MLIEISRVSGREIKREKRKTGNDLIIGCQIKEGLSTGEKLVGRGKREVKQEIYPRREDSFDSKDCVILLG